MLHTRGFHSTWVHDGKESPTLSISLPPDTHPGPVLSHAVQVLHCKQSTITLTKKVKSLSLVDCTDVAVHIPHGVVACVELQGCKKIVLYLAQGLASYYRSDDCTEVVFMFQTLPLDGVRVVSSGCHALRAQWGEEGSTFSIPDTLTTLLHPTSPSRTDLLHPGSGVGGWGGIEVPPRPTPPPTHHHKYDVCIVGGGVSGLMVAASLPPSLRVCLIEARDRVGGRVLSWGVGGHTVDLGAAWLHGGVHDSTHPAMQFLGGRGGVYKFPSKGNPWLSAPSSAILHVGLGEGVVYKRGGGGGNEGNEEEKEEEEAWKTLLTDIAHLAREVEREEEEEGGEKEFEGGAIGGKEVECKEGEDVEVLGEGVSFGALASYLLADLRAINPRLKAKLAWRCRSLGCWLGLSHPNEVGLGEIGGVPPETGGGGWGDFPGVHALPQSGMSSLVSALLQKASEGRVKGGLGEFALRLGTRVSHIDSTSNKGQGVKLVLVKGQGSEEEAVFAQHVVLTLPITCLAASTPKGQSCRGSDGGRGGVKGVNFTPPLPLWKTAALDSGEVTLSRYKKVIVAWDAPWWPVSWPPFIALHCSGSRKRSPFTLVENYLALKGVPILIGIYMGEKEGEGLSEASPSTPLYPLGHFDMLWNSNPQGFAMAAKDVLDACSQGGYTPPIAPTNGAPSTTTTTSSSFALVHTLLDAMKGVAHELGLPPPPPPIDSFVTSWEEDPLSGGCWACPGGKGGISEGTLKALRAPIPCGGGLAGEAGYRHSPAALHEILRAQGGIHFAGEACDSDHLGSVHACLRSGAEVSKTLEVLLTPQL